MSLVDLAIFLIAPSMVVIIICTVMTYIEIARDDDYGYYDEDDEPVATTKQRWIELGFKCSLTACCVGLYILALDTYLKGFYFFSVLLLLSPIWIFWPSKK